MESDRLKRMDHLEQRIAVYIPSTKNVDEAIDNSEYVDMSASLFSSCFGGATASENFGYWEGSKGLTKEQTTIVYSFCDEKALEENLDKVIDFCEWLCSELTQDAVSLDVNGTLYFISKKSEKRMNFTMWGDCKNVLWSP